ncbi:AP2/B3-like transcriptional factor family protein, partial [Prunus dulcis]
LFLSLSLSLLRNQTLLLLFFQFWLATTHLHASTTATTRSHLGRHRFRWNHETPYFPFHSTTASIRRRARRNQPRKVAVWTDFCQTFDPSFSLISPPNWTSKVLRPPFAAGGTLSGSGSVGLLVEFLGKCSIYRGDSAKIFGRKSRFLGDVGNETGFAPVFENSGASPVTSGSGSAWKVDLRRLDGERSLASFWISREFQIPCCIFDRTCTEVDYPLRKQEMEETDDTDDDFHEDSSDDSVEEQPDDSTCPRKTRKKSSLPCPRPQKKNRTSSRGKDDYPAKLGSGSTSSTRRFEKRTPGFLGSIRPLPKSGKATALQRANAYKSQHPLSVIVAMKPSYITGYILWLPSEFHDLYPIKNSGEVILRVLDRRTWPVNLKYGEEELNSYLLIDNKVKPLFDVVIFPNIEAATCPNDREQTVPEIEETNEDDDPSDDSGDADYLSDNSDNDSVEIIENCTPFPRRTKEKSPMPCPQPPKKNKASSSGKVELHQDQT